MDCIGIATWWPSQVTVKHSNKLAEVLYKVQDFRIIRASIAPHPRNPEPKQASLPQKRTHVHSWADNLYNAQELFHKQTTSSSPEWRWKLQRGEQAVQYIGCKIQMP